MRNSAALTAGKLACVALMTSRKRHLYISPVAEWSMAAFSAGSIPLLWDNFLPIFGIPRSSENKQMRTTEAFVKHFLAEICWPLLVKEYRASETVH